MALEKIINIVVDAKKAKSEMDVVQKEIKETDELTKGLTGTLDNLSGGALTTFSTLKSGLQTAVKGFNSLKVAIIGTGIGALIIAILAVKEAFTSSEEGQNKFAKLMAVIGSITGNLMDVLSDLGMLIIGVFENPQKALKDFANLIKDQIVNRFIGLLELIPQLGKAVGLLFQGKFKEAGQVAFDATTKVTTGVENLSKKIGDATEKTKEFIKEMEREAKIASQIADQRAKADKTDRALIVQKAEAERQRADLLEKAQQRDKFNQSERIQFLKDASNIDEEITKKEIESAKLRRDAKIEENKLSKSNKEALEEEENLKANVIRLETQRLQRQKEVTGQIQGLIEQEKANQKALFDEKKRILEEEQKLKEDAIKKEIEDETKRQESIESIRQSFRLKLEDLEDQFLIQKLERQKERDLIELEALNATEEQKYELKKYYAKLIADEEKRVIDEYNNEIEQEEIDRENKRLEDAEKQIRLEQTVADAKKEIQDSYLNSVSNGIGLLKNIFERNKGLQKASIVAESGIGVAKIVNNTQAANAAARLKYALLPGGQALAEAEVTLNRVNAGIGIASNLAATAKALTAIGGGGASLNGGNVGGGQSAPSFNLVQGTGSNQIAQSVGESKPVEAYVVGSNVTSQQELDRRRISGSSF